MTPKFKAGDKIEVIQNSLKGEILGVDKGEYSVQWNHYKDPCPYSIEESDPLWELQKGVNPLPTNSLNVLKNQPVIMEYEKGLGKTGSLKVNTFFKSCSHKWQDYTGLNEKYKFCTVCDEKDYN